MLLTRTFIDRYDRFLAKSMDKNRIKISPPQEKVAASIQNQAFCTIFFLYFQFLKTQLVLFWQIKL